MDWMHATADLLRAILWPCVVGFAIVMFNKPISGLIDRIKKLSYKDASIDVGEKVAEVAQSSRDLPESSNAPNILPGSVAVAVPIKNLVDADLPSAQPVSEHRPVEPDDATWGPIEHLAFRQPAMAIITAFDIVLGRVREISDDYPHPELYPTWREVVGRLQISRLLPSAYLRVFQQLGSIFDEARSNPFGIDISSAVTFVATAKNLVRSLAGTSLNLLAARRLGTLVREARIARDMTVAQLAASAGIDEQTIAELEEGTMPNVRERVDLREIDDALGWASGSAEGLLTEGRPPSRLQ